MFLTTSAGLLVNGDKGGLLLVEGADPSWWEDSDLLKGLPTPEQVKEWWEALKPVDRVDSSVKESEKPIDTPDKVSTAVVDTRVDMSTQVSTAGVDGEKPIDKPKDGENGKVSTVSTRSENGNVNLSEGGIPELDYEYVAEEE